jgi:hypothetical protein
MAILQALLALISKSAGKILNAIFGWAVRALFGQTTSREKTFLSVIVAAAVAWPLLLMGVAAPKFAALVLAFVPLPKAVPAWIVRLVWLALAVVVPIAVGLAVAAKAPPTARRESFVMRMLRGFPITVGLAAAFLIMFVSVPVMRLAALVRRQTSADVPLVTDAAAYHDIATRLHAVLSRHGFDLHPAAPGWWVSAPTRLLNWFGGDAFRTYVPNHIEHFVSPALTVSMYPTGVLLRGSRQRVTWAHGLIAEAVAHTDGLQTSDPKAQQIERQLHRLWKQYDGAPPSARAGQVLRSRLDDIIRGLGALDVDFEDWQVLYRQILQVERAIGGQRQLIDDEASAAASGDADRLPASHA